MIRLRRVFLLTAVAVLTTAVGGCAGAPAQSESLFLLQQPDSASATHSVASDQHSKKINLLLAAVDMAPYLTHDGIVYQAGPNRIVVAANNRWAAPLETQINTGLYRTLSRGLTDVRVRQANTAHAMQPDYRLQVNIDQFQGRYDGNAVISGSWQLLDSKHEIVAQNDFEQTNPLRSDGYAELVRALSHGWQQIEVRLQDNITQALAQQAGS